MTKHLTLQAIALLYRTTFFRDLKTLIRGGSYTLMSGCVVESRDERSGKNLGTL